MFSILKQRRHLCRFIYRFGGGFADRHSLRTASFDDTVINVEQIFSYSFRNLSKQFFRFLLLTVVIVTHKIPHNVTYAGRTGKNRITDVCAAGTATAAACLSVFSEKSIYAGEITSAFITPVFCPAASHSCLLEGPPFLLGALLLRFTWIFHIN